MLFGLDAHSSMYRFMFGSLVVAPFMLGYGTRDSLLARKFMVKLVALPIVIGLLLMCSGVTVPFYLWYHIGKYFRERQVIKINSLVLIR